MILAGLRCWPGSTARRTGGCSARRPRPAGLLFRHEHQTDAEVLIVQAPDGVRHTLVDSATSGRIAAWQPSPTGDLVAVQRHHDGYENGGLRLIPSHPGAPGESLADAAPFPAVAFVGDWLLYTAGTRTQHRLAARRLDSGAAHQVAVPVDGPVRLSLHAGWGEYLVLRIRPAAPATPDGLTWWVTRWTGQTVPDWQPLDVGHLPVTALALGWSRCYLAAGRVFDIDLARLARGQDAPLLPVGSPDTEAASTVSALRVMGPEASPRLVVLRRTGVTRRLDVHAPEGAPAPGSGFTWQARLRLGPVTTPSAGSGGDALWILADDPRQGTWSRRLASHVDLRGFSAPGQGTSLRTLTIASRDGTAVPVTVCDPNPHARHRPAPTVVTVYGGFGIALEPTWDPLIAAWLHAGGRVAWVHTRGGGEFGPAWAAAGRGTGKNAVVDDLCAAAATLTERGEAEPGQLAVLAASNGGLIAAAALTRTPSLFAAVVCAAPLADMTRYTVGGLGDLWREEYGNPTDPADLRGLLAYSPYHQVKEGTPYPAILLVTGGNDERVPAWHAWKLCAALQGATTGSAPILLDHHDSSGHYGRSGNAARRLGAGTLGFMGAATGLRPRIVGAAGHEPPGELRRGEPPDTPTEIAL